MQQLPGTWAFWLDNLVYKLRQIVCKIDFLVQLKKTVSCFKKICYNMNIL